jgi:hypothetical protein
LLDAAMRTACHNVNPLVINPQVVKLQ